MPDRAALKALVRRNMALSAAINAAFSLAFFLAVFGWPARPLTWAAPDGLALDFLPQSGMVALMSALVPPLAERRALAALTGSSPRPALRTIRAALGWAAGGLVAGAILAALCSALPLRALAAPAALALKLFYGAALGAGVTALALRPR